MATNRKYADGTHLAVAATNPASPVTGEPIRYGNLTGIALTDEGEGGNVATKASVDFSMAVYEVTVDDNEGAGIAVGDVIYYHDTGTGSPSSHLNNSAASADAVFGIALETVGAGATTAIDVLHLPFGFTTAISGTAGTGQIADDAITAAKIAAGAVEEAELSDALTGATDGLGLLRVAKATFDPTTNAGERTQAAHGLGVTIPDNAIVCGGFVDVITTFQSAGADAGTIALHVQGANDIVTATAISAGGNIWDAGLHAIVPKANTPESTGIKLTAAREITATVATQDLTAGKLTVFLYYVQGD